LFALISSAGCGSNGANEGTNAASGSAGSLSAGAPAASGSAGSPSVAGNATANAGANAGGKSGTQNGGGGAGAAPDVSRGGASACVTVEPEASPLRRLTRLEYDNTIRDLLGLDLKLAARFPPDAVAGGFSNNASVLTISPLLAEKYMEAAETLAAEVVEDLAAHLPCDPAAIGEDACAREFIQVFGRRAYRRPLAVADTERLLRAYTAGRSEGSFAEGIGMVLRAALQSPSFLYRFEFGANAAPGEKLVRLSPSELAARLSYFLWASMPDEQLTLAADSGQLATPQGVAAQARSMLAQPRARRAVTEFYDQWLALGALDTLIKDPLVHPEFTPELRAAMRAETPAFVEHVLWSGDGRLSTLLTSPIGFTTAPLAALYGVSQPSGAGPSLVSLAPSERAGLLTQAGVLAVHALPNQSSPVTRGKFVRERFLCQEPPAPPPNLNVTPPEVDATRSTRERFAQHTADAACSVCHELMDPIGFGFEAYDAVGRFRTTDAGKSVDDSGWVAKSADLDGTFRGARELGEKLAASAQVRDCVTTQWLRYALGRFEGAGDLCSLTQLQSKFNASGGDLRELLIELTQTEAFLYRRAVPAEELTP
jgi:hypothetical protein